MNILFLIESALPALANEQSWVTLTESFGHTVTVIDRHDVATDTADTYDMVIYGPEGGGEELIKDWDTPILCLNAYRARSTLRMGNNASIEPLTNAVIQEESSPLAAGMSGTVEFYTLAPAALAVLGNVGAGAEYIAQNGSDGLIVHIPLGGDLYDAVTYGTAAERRVFFAAGGDVGADELTANGETLFEAAVAFTGTGLGLASAPAFNTPGYNNGPSYPDSLPVVLEPQHTIPASPAATYALVGTPTGVAINSSTGVVTVSNPIAGNYSFDVTATNSEGSDTTSVAFTVVVLETGFHHDNAIAFLSYDDDQALGADVSGLVRNVTVNNGTQTTAGGLTDALELSGLDTSNVDLSALIAATAGSTAFSFSTKIRFKTVSGVQIIFNAHNTVEDGNFTIYQNGGDLVFQLSEDVTDFIAGAASSTFVADTDYVLSFTTGPSGWKVWVDKVLVDSGVETSSMTDLTQITNMWLGKWSGNSDFPLDGYLKDTYISSSELTQSTVDQIVDNDVYGYDIMALLGQSNSVGTEPITVGVDDQYSTVAGKVVQWGYDSQTLTAATNTLDHQAETAGDMGYWLSMCNALVDQIGYKRSILLVPASKGATGFSDGDWNPTDTVFEGAKASILAATNLSTLSSYRSDIFILGENDADASSTANAFETAFEASIADLVSNIPMRVALTPTVFVGIKGSSAGQGAVDVINGALQNLAAVNSDRYYISTADLTLVDTYHYDQASTREIGSRIAGQVFGVSSVPVISGITNHKMNETAVISGVFTTPITSVVGAGRTYAITAESSTEISVTVPRGGLIGSSVSVVVTDASGVSAPSVTTLSLPTGYSLLVGDTFSVNFAGLPGYSAFFGSSITTIDVGDQAIIEDIDGFTFDDEGVPLEFHTPGSYDIDVWVTDASDSYNASAITTMTVTIADNVSDAFSFDDVTDAVTGQTYSDTALLTGVAADTTLYITNGNGELSNDGTNWSQGPVEFIASQTYARATVVASNSASSVTQQAVEVNGVSATMSVTTAAADVTGPGVTLNGPSGTQTGPISVDIVFDEAFTQTLTASMITVTGGTKGTLSGSGLSYSIAITPTAETTGNIVVDFDAGQVSDAASNGNTASNTLTIPFDTTANDITGPTVTLAGPSGTQTGAYNITATFNEAFNETLTSAMFGVTNGTKGALTNVGLVYTLVVTPTADAFGNSSITFAADQVNDGDDNPNTAATPLSIPYNTVVAPEGTITATVNTLSGDPHTTAGVVYSVLSPSLGEIVKTGTVDPNGSGLVTITGQELTAGDYVLVIKSADFALLGVKERSVS